MLRWTFQRGREGDRFRREFDADEATWARAWGWALGKALITLAGGGTPRAAEIPPDEVVRAVLGVYSAKE